MIRYSLMFFAVFSVLLTTGDAHAQAKKRTFLEQNEMTRRWEEFKTPGAPHALLVKLVGTWKVENTMWMGGPAGKAETSTGSSTYSSVLGGRYVQQDMNSSMLQMPYRGIGMFGYDNFKKKYTGFWIDDMSTAISVMEGTMDEKTGAITFWGKMDDPTTQEKDKKVKYILRIVDNNTHVFELFDVTGYGEKAPVMRVKYSRTK